MWRDFTYIDDIVSGVLRALDRPPAGAPPHALTISATTVREADRLQFAVLESAIGRRRRSCSNRMQPGDVAATYADIESSPPHLGFEPTTAIREASPASSAGTASTTESDGPRGSRGDTEERRFTMRQ